MALIWPPKDPDEDLDYDIDWTDALYSADELVQVNALLDAGLPNTITPADSVSTIAFTMPSGAAAVAHDPQVTAAKTKIWIRGGVAGDVYEIDVLMVTASTPPRKFDRTVKLKIKDK